jgi:hypothetical protein
MTRFAAYFILLALCTSAATAQQTTAPEPIVRTTIDPPRVVVGQMATLRLLVLGPNYMPAPPVIPEFQVRNAVTRAAGAVNQTETHDGITYAGVQYEFAVYPQEPGRYAIANQNITVTFAADPPKSTKTTIVLPRLEFEAFIPDIAQDLDPFIAAGALTVEQALKQSSQDLKVGDSVTRSVTVKAEGTPAMLLPPTNFVAIAGLALYPGQPSLTENVDRRTGSLSATRLDEGTYMLEAAGDYTLPPVEIAWWNARDARIEHARADAIVLRVAENPALRAAGTSGGSTSDWSWRAGINFILDHWPAAAVVLFALGMLAWFAPAAIRTLRDRIRLRRSAYLNSEAWSYARLRAASRDPQKFYFALLNWLERFTPLAPPRTIDSFKQVVQDPLLDREIASVEANLFSPQRRGRPNLSSRQLLKRVKIARRRLLRSASAHLNGDILPDSLNPVSAAPQARALRRPVAR